MNQSDLKRSKILIVDDIPENVRLLESMLTLDGYTNLCTLTNSRQALELIDKEPFDLFILDLQMPYVTGFDLMAKISELKGEEFCPVMVISAQTDRESRDKALSLGASDFLTKPFDIGEVLLRVRNLLQTRALYVNQLRQSEQLELRVRIRTHELEATRLSIVQILGRAAEFRDNETGNHVIRMSKISQRLAQGIGLDDQLSKRILHAAPMHDIGKIAIPDHILLKPGKLTSEEWDIMQSHAGVGSDIIGTHSSPLIQMAQRIAESHHEKWDGSGYPKGLVGEEIPIEARIAAIADVFDALLSVRPYKKAWPLEDAVELINQQRGIHFDPSIVDVFNEVLQDILEIRQEYSEPCEESE